MRISGTKLVQSLVWFPGSRSQNSLVERDLYHSLVVKLIDKHLQGIPVIILIELKFRTTPHNGTCLSRFCTCAHQLNENMPTLKSADSLCAVDSQTPLQENFSEKERGAVALVVLFLRSCKGQAST